MSLTTAQVITAVLSGDVDDGFERIQQAVKERQKIVGQINLRRLQVGTRVELFGLSPKTLNGAQGVITGRNNTRFDVKTDHDIFMRGRITDSVPGVPASCLRAIEE